jgi:hypothetical protein
VLALVCALPGAARAQSSHKSSSSKASSTPAEPLSVMDEKAKATFKEGLAAFDRRDFEAARVAFLQTFALKPAVPVVRRNLGLAEIYSGHYLDGARRLARVLHTTEEGSSEDRARMLESLKKAEAHLERVSMEVRQEGAEITIDGVDLGASPLPFLWYVAPGSYEVKVQKAGFVDHTESRLALAGAAQHLVIVLAAVPAPAPPAPAPRAPPVDVAQRAGPNGWLLLTGGVLSVAALASGAAFTVAAARNLDKAERLGNEFDAAYPDSDCSEANLQECGPLLEASQAHDRQQKLALASFAVAGVATVATLLYGFLGGGAATSDGEDDPALAHESGSGLGLSAGWLDSSPYLAWSGRF